MASPPPLKLRKKVSKRAASGLLSSAASWRQAVSLGVAAAPFLRHPAPPAVLTAQDLRLFLKRTFTETSPSPHAPLFLGNAGAVDNVVLVLVEGVHPNALKSSGYVSVGAGVRAFEGSRPVPMVEALLYGKKGAGSLQAVRKRKRALSEVTTATTPTQRVPLESFVAEVKQLRANGFGFAEAAEPATVAIVDESHGDGHEALAGVEMDAERAVPPTKEAAESLLGQHPAVEVAQGPAYRCVAGERQGGPRLLGLDCEMVETSAGFELGRLSVVRYIGTDYGPCLGADTVPEDAAATGEQIFVETRGPAAEPPAGAADEEASAAPPTTDDVQTLLDIFVRPERPVQNYHTEFSGLTPALLDATAVTFAQAQAAFLRLLRPEDFLVGHSLENDFKCLRVAHWRVIDTALLFPHPQGPPRRPSLKWLAKTYLGVEIRAGPGTGHDSVEDAAMALAVARKKFDHGPHFGLNASLRHKESVLQLVACHGRNRDAADAGSRPRAVWVSHAGAAALHLRPGVESAAFVDFRVESIAEAVGAALQSADQAEETPQSLVVLPIEAPVLATTNAAAADGDHRAEATPEPPGVSEEKLAKMLSQGFDTATSEALDSLLSAVEGAIGHAAASGDKGGEAPSLATEADATVPEPDTKPRTLVLVASQVNIRQTVLPALKQKQACSNVRSASIWTSRQQKLLDGMVDAARALALSYKFV